MKILDFSKLKDNRNDCYSILSKISVQDYLKFIKAPYKKKGGIEEQREPLKTNSGKAIRERMVKDIGRGTILPPIVLGLMVSERDFKKLKTITTTEFEKLLGSAASDNISIIDGMQRTTALFEVEEEKMFQDEYHVRIEFWITTKINSLIYRMLILNTGQVPWNLRRQIEVVFRSMIKEISESVKEINIIKINDKERRTNAGEFHANSILELYLVFGSRKEKIDTRERLADEYSRLDFIETSEEEKYIEYFYELLNYLGKIDKQFSRYKNTTGNERFSNGLDFFESQTAKVGFIAAFAIKIIGRSGSERTKAEIKKQWDISKKQLDDFVKYLNDLTPTQIGKFLSYDILNEKLAKKSARVGDYEREFFLKAFETLIDDKMVAKSMQSYWLAY